MGKSYLEKEGQVVGAWWFRTTKSEFQRVEITLAKTVRSCLKDEINKICVVMLRRQYDVLGRDSTFNCAEETKYYNQGGSKRKSG